VTYLYLMCAALSQRKMRTAITLLSILTAFLLFGFLDSVRNAFASAGQDVYGLDRLVTTSKISPFVVPLPRSLSDRIQSVPGVTLVGYGNDFSGAFRDPKNAVSLVPITDNYFDLYPEWHISAAERNAYNSLRTGAVAEDSLARKYKWKIGDRISLLTHLPQKDGSTTWTVDLVGIYYLADPNRMDDERALSFHWDYFDQARQDERGTVGWYIIKVADPSLTDSTSQAIDALSANSDHETSTESENAWAANVVSQFGNVGVIVGSIMGAVCFTLMLLAGNVMAQNARERIPEFAILKTVGFTARGVMALILGESVLMLLVGSVLGLAAASVLIDVGRSTLNTVIPISPVGAGVWFRGLLLAVVIGLIVGAPSALRGMRLRIVDALIHV
jgi:putative ABC transport system permease protein